MRDAERAEEGDNIEDVSPAVSIERIRVASRRVARIAPGDFSAPLARTRAETRGFL